MYTVYGEGIWRIVIIVADWHASTIEEFVWKVFRETGRNNSDGMRYSQLSGV
jgi:hypothetical protein